MALPKPEYIQTFINEKLKRGQDGERQALIEGDELAREEKINGKHSERKMNGNRHGVSRNKGSASEVSSALSSAVDSDDQERRKSRKNHGSESDVDTDDSAVGDHDGKALLAKQRSKKTKDVRTPLRSTESANGTYGGTDQVNLDAAETLASYSSSNNGFKGILKLGGSSSKSSDRERLTERPQSSKSHSHKSGSCGGKNHDHNHGNNGGASHHSHGDHDHDHDHDHGHDHHHGEGGSTGASDIESEHCHDSSDEQSEIEQIKRNKALRKLLIATGLSFVFMVGEVVGGYFANSLAVMTDASHLLTDVSSFLISILALKMAARPISKNMTFGWHRAEIVGAIVSVLAIWVVTGVLVYLAVMRLINKDYEVNGKTMLITASMAVGFNILMGLVLHEHGHLHGGHSHGGHSHGGHSHGDGDHKHDGDAESQSDSSYSGDGKKKTDNMESGNVNVRAAFIHVIGDLLQSLGVLTAAFIIYFKPEYKMADPICTFLFSVLVLATTITILRDTIIVIMEGTPVGIEYSTVKEKLLEIEGVHAVHDLRLWSLTLNQSVMSAHLAIDKSIDPSVVLKAATRKLKGMHNFHSLTIQIENYSEDMDDCKKCQPA